MRRIAYSPSVLIIQPPSSSRTAAAAMSLGTKVSEDSWICVTVWRMLTRRPTTVVTPISGAASLIAVHNMSADMARAMSEPRSRIPAYP